MAYHFRNLVFEGGGVKGIAYVGVMEVLEQKGILPKIKRVGGTSAGAINAVLTALRYTNDEVEDVLSNLNFNNFMDDSWGFIRDAERIVDEFGLYKGDYFREWIGDRIAEKTGNRHSTFGELRNDPRFLDLYVCGTNLSTHFSEVFSPEHTPRMRIADAVRISMSIPLFFAAVRHQPRGDVYVDGGVLRNYPIKLFDRAKYLKGEPAGMARDTKYYKEATGSVQARHASSSAYLYNRQTLGFRLDSSTEISMFRDGAEPPHNKIENFLDYAVHLVKTMMDAEISRHLHSDDWQRTIYVDTLGVGTTDFDLTDERKQALVASGRKGATDYFKWFDDPRKKPVNRPA
jgi:NTE family protein